MPTLRPIDQWFLNEVLPFEARFVGAARRLLRNPDDAHDLVQEVFTRLFVLEGWADIVNPRAYVLRMLRNLAIERIRRSQIVEFQHLADIEELNLIDDGPDPYRVANAQEQVQRIWAVLESMPPEYRTVLIQRRFEDEPLSALAREMGMSVSTLEKRLARALYLLNEGLRTQEASQARESSTLPNGNRKFF
jgi:RNA polymerase sigma factor (sigma-70 family)